MAIKNGLKNLDFRRYHLSGWARDFGTLLRKIEVLHLFLRVVGALDLLTAEDN